MTEDNEFVDPNDEITQKILRFKQNTANVRRVINKTLEKSINKSKKKTKPRVYRVILVDSGDNEGNFLELSKEISVFEFADILSNIFGLEVDINYSDEVEDSMSANGLTFESVEDLLDFLSDREISDDDD